MKKIIALALVMLMCIALLAGCGEKADNDADPGATQSEAKTLVMGTNAAFPPYEFVDDNNVIVGIDAEIAKAICDKLGYKLEIKDMEFDSLISAVQGNAIDFSMAGMTVTDERKESVAFSNTYATGVQVIIVKEGSAIATVDDLDGKTIGVQSGTTGDIYCTDDYGADHVKQYSNGALAIAALQNDQVDCVVIDNEPAKSFVAANTGLKILDTEYVTEDYAIAIAKENTALLNDFNTALDALKADGTIDAILGKYIKAE